MRRVVVTGMGIVSSIGNNVQEVTTSLHDAKSGIVRAEDYARLGFRCQVHGAPNYDLETIDRRVKRFMGDGAAWNYVAMQQAIADSGLEEKDVKNDRTGLIMGSGGPRRHVVHQLGNPCNTFRHSRCELFHLVGLRHVGPLHWQWHRNDPMGQAGHCLRRRRRGIGLDTLGVVRCHGRHVVQI
jgi:3-oxoacyl-(acyl-carrier-protein) synthase